MQIRWSGRILAILGGVFAICLAALGLAWVSNEYIDVKGWENFILSLILSGFIVYLGLFSLRREKLPGWLLHLVIAAAILRILVGAIWVMLLPGYGYDTEVQNAGYIMEDAYRRDKIAWHLSQSDRPLYIAFRETEFGNFRNVDQYGGLLFFSAGVYRYLGGQTHFPLMMVVFSASFSALSVAFTWAFARRVLDEGTAKWAAWGITLFPEAVLLGSTQMREPFFLTLAAVSLYGLALYLQDRNWRSLVWVFLGLVFILPLSPPLTGILLGSLFILGLGMEGWGVRKNPRLWLALAGGVFLVSVGVWLAWEQIAPRLSVDEYGSPLAMVADWAKFAARWQATTTKESSGWVQKIVRGTPEWLDLPFLIAYGVSRPLLPSALVANGAPFWRIVGIWRALGWTILLPILIYAPLRALRFRDSRTFTLSLSLVVWIVVLIAAFWGGADQWDNPRYRMSFTSFQMVLAGWVVVSQKQAPDPWMRRALVGVLAVLTWFIPWYIRRYTPLDWAVVDLFKVLGLGLSTAVLYAIWDWMKQIGGTSA